MPAKPTLLDFFRLRFQPANHVLQSATRAMKTGMTEEIGRARAAVERARDGANVALISSGDAGVYGMAGLVFEVLREMNWKSGESPELRIVPGITALNSCASLLGAQTPADRIAAKKVRSLFKEEIAAKRQKNG